MCHVMSRIHIHIYTSIVTLARQGPRNASRNVTYTQTHALELYNTRLSVATLECVTLCHVYIYTCT